MIYYRVKTTSDGYCTNPKALKNQNILIANELYTVNEIIALKITVEFVKKHFDRVSISKFDTYYFFGARRYKTEPTLLKHII